MEASHLPVLNVLNLEPDSNRDNLEITLENTGNGPASSLSATIHFCPVAGSGSCKMPRFSNRGNRFRPLTRNDGTGSTTIQADNSENFIVNVWMPDFREQDTSSPITQGIDTLVDQGITQVDMQVAVRFEHLLPTKESGYIYLEMRRADISRGMSFSDLWDSSSKWVVQPIDTVDSEKPFRAPGQYYEENYI